VKSDDFGLITNRITGLVRATFQVMRRTYSTLSYDGCGDAKLAADRMGQSDDVNHNGLHDIASGAAHFAG
jgi:hypothetical protein